LRFAKGNSGHREPKNRDNFFESFAGDVQDAERIFATAKANRNLAGVLCGPAHDIEGFLYSVHKSKKPHGLDAAQVINFEAAYPPAEPLPFPAEPFLPPPLAFPPFLADSIGCICFPFVGVNPLYKRRNIHFLTVFRLDSEKPLKTPMNRGF
jgi:hypothetical protein